MPQKFQKGDRVKIAIRLPKYMSHFGHEGEEAIVVGSYTDQYSWGGKDGRKEYTLMVQYPGGHWGQCSWWEEDLLTLVKKRTAKSLLELETIIDANNEEEYED